jgi:calcineurin-like phosphoesterase family protein
MSVFIIGCLHLGHEKMAIRRGFLSSSDHDNYLIKQWNKVISKRHKVFILGDVSMEKDQPYELLKELNGYKHVILGNHDLPQDVPKLLNYVDKISGPFKYQNEYWLTQDILMQMHTDLIIHPSHLKK